MAGESDVQVRFGAQLDGLIAGINQAKEELESISAPISGIVSAFQGLGEAAVAALAVDRVIEFSEKYAELGESIERTSQILGITTDQVQQLGFAIRMGGGDAATATLTMGIFEKNIAEAASGSGTAASAFENMGIAVKDADGNTRSAIDILKDMADVLSKVSDANIRAEYGRALLGRGYQNLLPVLLEGKEGFDKLNAILDQTNSKLSNDQVKALDESAKKTKELSASWDGLMIELGADSAWTGAKQNAIDLTETMTDFAKATGSGVREFEEFLGLAQQTVQPTALNEFNDAAAKFKIAMQETGGGGIFGPNQPPGIKLPPLKTDGGTEGKEDDTATQIAQDQIKTEEELAKIGLQTQKDMLAQELAANKITKAQEFATLQDYLTLEYQVESEALDRKLALYGEDTREYAQTLNQKRILDAQFEQQLARLAAQGAQAQAQANQKTAQLYKSVTDVIGRDFDTMLSGVLQGTQTWQAAMGKMFSDLAVSAVEAIAKIIAEWLVFEVLTEGQGSWGDFMALEQGGKAGIGSQISRSFAVGSWSVPSTGPAFIHEGEMIIPAAQAAALRSGSASLGGSGGGDQYSVTIHAVDAQSFANLLQSSAGQKVILNTVQQAARNNNSQLNNARR